MLRRSSTRMACMVSTRAPFLHCSPTLPVMLSDHGQRQWIESCRKRHLIHGLWSMSAFSLFVEKQNSTWAAELAWQHGCGKPRRVLLLISTLSHGTSQMSVTDTQWNVCQSNQSGASKNVTRVSVHSSDPETLVSVFSSPMIITRDILRAEGARGLYRGLTTTLVRECPGYGCFFGAYEFTRSLLTKQNESKNDIGRISWSTDLETMPDWMFINRLCAYVGFGWYGWHLFLAVDVSHWCREITNTSISTKDECYQIHAWSYSKRR